MGPLCILLYIIHALFPHSIVTQESSWWSIGRIFWHKEPKILALHPSGESHLVIPQDHTRSAEIGRAKYSAWFEHTDVTPKAPHRGRVLIYIACIFENINRFIITGKELFDIITSTYRSSSVSGKGRASGLSILASSHRWPAYLNL